ncbi:hypothetical protein L8C07_05395 [Paenibacillus sp. CMAA1739]|uniref:hypothetical protein n=1 Tax=Paenibacillus ottowii TaxID=2315729 RepID=UPI002DBF89D4|nr:hypothetical protein [Paenibacillus sp. CMAA1739]MEC4565372.1 hypothetical protein [Paenibacillus sp. CMAA1739]
MYNKQDEGVGNVNLGKYIKDIIKAQGRTIAWVSDQLSFNERTLAGKLNRNSVSGDDLMRLSILLGINLEELKEEYKMKITEYTILDFKGYNGPVPYHYVVVKLGENLYYKTYQKDRLEVTQDIRYASHIEPKYGDEQVEFIKKFYDEFGKRK